MEEILSYLNNKIREEHGNRVSMDSVWKDAEVDSFGTTMVLLEMNDKYGCFNKEWFKESNIAELSIREIVERAYNESKVL